MPVRTPAADRVKISLEYGHDLTLRISDNGGGIDAAMIETGKQGHFGLPGMRERAERIGARLTLTSELGTGTVVAVIVPGRLAFTVRVNQSIRRLCSIE